MEYSLFTQLSIVLVVVATVSGVMRLLRQPLIIGYIISGVLVGPTFLDILGNQEAFHAFSSLGIALLLFIIGLGLNVDIIKRLGRVVIVTAMVQMVLTALIGGLVALTFGVPLVAASILGLAVSFSSTIVIIKLLNDKREQRQLYGQIAIGILIVQDVVASIALLFVAAGDTGNLPATELAMLFAKGIALAAGLTLVVTQILPRLERFVASSQEFLFLFAIAWGFGIATVFEFAGLSLEVGALFAGVSLASLPYSQGMAARLKPLRDFFVVIFFVVLGEGLQLADFLGSLPLAIGLSVVALAIKPLIVLMSMGALAYTKRTSFKTAVSLGQISEFSIIFVILAVSEGIIPPYLNSAITLVALITIAASTYLMKYDDHLFRILNSTLQLFEREVVKTARERRAALQSYSQVLFGYNKGGAEIIRAFERLHEPFVVVDYDPDVIKLLEQKQLAFRYGDAADPELLEELDIEKAKLVISTITNHDTSMGLVRYVAGMSPKATIVCHANSLEEARELYDAGATYVMLPHAVGGEKIGSLLAHGIEKVDFEAHRRKQLAALEHKI
ncbi:MAG: cation:proton antiporter [Candidatus Saccharimonadales bacterium]